MHSRGNGLYIESRIRDSPSQKMTRFPKKKKNLHEKKKQKNQRFFSRTIDLKKKKKKKPLAVKYETSK